jgi:hypothetical protein
MFRLHTVLFPGLQSALCLYFDRLKLTLLFFRSSIFASIEADRSGALYTIKCSFMEIYMEAVRDLLGSNPTATLRVHESPTKGVFVDGLTEEYVGSPGEILELLRTGEKSRVVAQTKMNAVSSRSHRHVTVFCVFRFE